MKKLFVMTLLLTIGLAFTSCAGGGLGGTIKGESFKSEGWVDDNTFRVIGTGAPKDGLTNKVQRKGTAKEAAIIVAQKAMVEKFVGARIDAAAGMADYKSTGIAVAKEFSGTIKGGSVVKETYDEEENCEVVYELKAKGLKKKVEATDIK